MLTGIENNAGTNANDLVLSDTLNRGVGNDFTNDRAGNNMITEGQDDELLSGATVSGRQW